MCSHFKTKFIFCIKWSSKVDIVEKRNIKIDIASYQILFPNIIFSYFKVFPFKGWTLKRNMLKGVIFGIRKAIAMCKQPIFAIFTVFFKVASQPGNFGRLSTNSADFFISCLFYNLFQIIAFPPKTKLLAASGVSFR